MMNTMAEMDGLNNRTHNENLGGNKGTTDRRNAMSNEFNNKKVSRNNTDRRNTMSNEVNNKSINKDGTDRRNTMSNEVNNKNINKNGTDRRNTMRNEFNSKKVSNNTSNGNTDRRNNMSNEFNNRNNKNTNTRKAMNAGTRNSADIEGSNKKEKYMWLNNSDLQISPDIQRHLNPMRVAKIASEFSPLIANPIKVSYRDGKYYIFDGMHTREAEVIVNGREDFPIFCRVYYELSKKDEARLFAEQFGSSEAVSMGYRLRALEVAEDPAVLEFLDVTRESGFDITLGSHKSCNGRIVATVTAFEAFGNLGSNKYGYMLRLIHKTWAGESWSVNRYILGGMSRFMKTYDVKTNTFVKAFRGVTYEDIRRIAERFPGMTKDGAFASAIADIYDRHSDGNERAR